MADDLNALWDYNDPGASEARFREVLEKTTDDDQRLQLQTQIARAQGLQRRFAEAHQTLNTVEALLTDALIVPRIRYLLERGRVFNSSGEREQAKPLFIRAYELAKAHNQDFYAVDAAHMIAIVETPEQALAWNLKALAEAEASAQPNAQSWKGSLHNNIGWTYHDSADYDKALVMFQKAQAWHESQGQAARARIAQWCIARTLRSLGRIDEALTLLRELETPESDGYVYEELGENLLLQGKSAEAQPYFAKAYALLSQDVWLAASEAARLDRLKTLGGI